MPYNIRMVSTYPPRRCGIGTFSRDLASSLEHFTGEVGNIRIAAIDNENLPYSIPVDLVINQYDPKSWNNVTRDIVTRAGETSNPTVVLLQHEYGLDPGEDDQAGMGNNFVNMAVTFAQKGINTLVYLHTVLDNPDAHQRKILQDLGKYSDGLVVTTESAVHILESPAYGIDHDKLKHIDHGIRMQHPSQYDRLAIKRQYGLEDRFVAVTLGLISPGKGIEYGIRAYGRFIEASCTEAQRERIVYLIAGRPHPEFVGFEDGLPWRNYQQLLEGALQQSGLRWCKVMELGGADFEKYDVIFLDSFLSEGELMRLYGAANVVLLPYLEEQQISSGILADTLGAGRVAVATKFRYALELLYSNRKCQPGLTIGRHARGILVDQGEASVEQIAQALDYLVFNKDKRLKMEKQAHQRGYQMRWDNSAWAMLQYVESVREEKRIVTGRGTVFHRQKPSSLGIEKGLRIP